MFAKAEEDKAVVSWRFQRNNPPRPLATTNTNVVQKAPNNLGTSNPIPTRRLSPQELREKREKGLCFYCDKKFTAEHKCRNQKLFQLEIAHMVEEEEEECGFEDVNEGAILAPM